MEIFFSRLRALRAFVVLRIFFFAFFVILRAFVVEAPLAVFLRGWMIDMARAFLLH
jgi:hypothetical protein